MLRSRDNSKNAHLRTGIQTDEPMQKSSFSKYGILVCLLFTIVVVYFVFTDNNSNPISSKSNINTIKKPSNTDPSQNPPNAPIGGSISSKSSPLPQLNHPPKLSRNAFSTKSLLHPKVLSDLNPLANKQLQRLINRRDNIMPPTNKLNPFHHLPNPKGEIVNAAASNVQSDTNEVSFTLSATSLPRSHGKEPNIFVRQTYPLKGFNHDFVLIFLHGAAFSSATWSKLGILQSLAQQGYVSYALDVPNYGQSVKIPAINNKWLSEIIHQLTGREEGVAKRITGVGGISTAGKKYILITASMSGSFAIPLLLSTPDGMIGMITVAPIGTDKYKKEQYEKVSIPVCIIYGEKDVNLGRVSKENLIQIPNHKVIMVPGGSHAAYMNDPEFFHQQVVRWLSEFFD